MGCLNGAFDILCILPNALRIGIEIKYGKKAADFAVGDERYHLSDTGADDLVCYGMCKDVWRLEQLLEEGEIEIGMALLVTNWKKLWECAGGTPNHDRFRVCEGRTLTGELDWLERRKTQAQKEYENKIPLTGKYLFHWEDLPTEISVKFKFLFIPILPQN